MYAPSVYPNVPNQFEAEIATSLIGRENTGMNWLARLIKQSQLVDEVFIDDSGFVYGADGDTGDQNHDSVVLEAVLGVLDDFDELAILDVMELSEEQMQVVDQNYPGFVEFVAGGGLPKEYAVLKMGWIRVLDSYFEAANVTEDTLIRIVDYAMNETSVDSGSMQTNFRISDRVMNTLVDFTLGELFEAVNSGRGLYLFRKKAKEESMGLY